MRDVTWPTWAMRISGVVVVMPGTRRRGPTAGAWPLDAGRGRIPPMEHRFLGGSGFRVPALSFGTATFGGGTEFFRAWGTTGVDEATRLVDIALDDGVNLFDSAASYSNGLAEEILGKAIAGRRHKLLLSTKASFRIGEGPNDV